MFIWDDKLDEIQKKSTKEYHADCSFALKYDLGCINYEMKTEYFRKFGKDIRKEVEKEFGKEFRKEYGKEHGKEISPKKHGKVKRKRN